MSHSSKAAIPSPKLMESSIKAVKVEIVQKVNEEAVRGEAEALEVVERLQGSLEDFWERGKMRR